MNAMVLRVAAVGSFLLAATGCIVTPETAEVDDEPRTPGFVTNDDGLPPEPPPTTMPAAPKPSPASGAVKEAVVHVSMRDKVGGGWFCTGTLVSPTTVVTAGHCVDPSKFVRYTIIAANVAGMPRVAASSPRMFGGTYEDVANPDLGALTLQSPITLSTYAELTDVTADVEAGKPVEGAGIVRVDEEPDAPFAETDPMSVQSAVPFGYEHGFMTPLFSKGGDSGSGLFLVENGVVTNKLIGVARQPEPDRDIDHFSRVDAGFLAWMAE